ncbi:hypothetical protein CEUSTIGMA_g5257.t1 [Chlamydomonas eustigma]|uniref:Uncharacterized protein n=1 Tax=Chlamydomonas eustigma TaxID=1157962 RepID=A0A250X408_9CHLO|nr:hypothetical protein CEUSTIGMA_g5257.t1 [Chlamydomonas eustigma]|eukprot:GAX77814.1 hypothetical protein CEUSTIGMA_g5257.t1 [Chlamydomonas eustigma]
MGTFNARYFPVLQLELPVYSAEYTLAIIAKFLGEWGFLSTLQIFHMESQYLKLSVTSTVGLSKDELDAHTTLCLSRLEGRSAFGLAPVLRDISQHSRCQHSHRDKEKGHVEDTTDLQEKKPNSGSMLLKTKTNPTETELQDSLDLCAHVHPRRNNNDQPTNVEGIVVREESMEELDVSRPKQGGAPKFVPRAPKAPPSSSRARFATTARDRRPHQHMTPRAVSMAGSGACNCAGGSFYPARWEVSSYHQEHDPHFYALIPGQKCVMVRSGLNNGASLERCASSTAWAPGYDKYGIALLRGGSSGYGHGGKVVQYVNTEAEPTPKRSEDFHCTKRSEDFHCNARHSSLSEFERSHGAVRLRGHSPEVRTRMSNSMAERYDVVAKLSPAQLTRDT